MTQVVTVEPSRVEATDVEPPRTRTGPGAIELLAATAVIAVLMAAAWGSYIGDGGLTSDDWANAESLRHRGYVDAVVDAHHVMGSKPLLAVLLPLPFVLFGMDAGAMLVLALGLGVLMAAAFYLVLRNLRFKAHEAGAIAALLVLFPWSDSMRLWVTGSLNQVSVTVYLLALVLALRGLRSGGWRGLAWHAAVPLLYATSILAYDAVAMVALSTGGIYLFFAPGWRALGRWALDAVAVGAAITYTAMTTAKTIRPWPDQLANAVDMLRGIPPIVMDALLPTTVPRQWVGYALAGLLIAAVVVAWRLPSATDLRRWLVVAPVALLAIGAGYAVFVPAAYWTPQSPNLENRVNLVTALGLVVLVYALLRIAVALVLPFPAEDWRVIALATAAVVAVGAGYGPKISEDKRLWAQAAAEQRTVLAAIRQAVPNPQPGDRILTFGWRASVAERLPVFYDSWDLWTAVKLTYADASLTAYPVFAGSRLECGAESVRIFWIPAPSPAEGMIPSHNAESNASPYRRVWFVDAPRATARRIDSRDACRTALRDFTPGPFR